MKKKSTNARKKIHNKLLKHLKNPKINKIYKIFQKNLEIASLNNSFVAAVSGGPDSLALAYFLKCFSIIRKVDVFFYHVDHRLRKESSKEAKLIKKELNKFDINCKIIIWRGKKPLSNIQSEARKKRYELIANKCSQDNVKYILTAHHIDDLYENFFIRVLRGSGLEGLVSFNSFKKNYNNDLILLRPMINVSKNELVYIAKNVFNFSINDPSNKNIVYKRSRIRKLIEELKTEGLDFKKLILTINNLSYSNNSINYIVHNNLKINVKAINKNTQFILSENFFKNPSEIVFRSMGKILKKMSKKYYPPRGKSVVNLIESIQEQKFKKMTLYGCVIEKVNNSVIIYKEFKKIS